MSRCAPRRPLPHLGRAPPVPAAVSRIAFAGLARRQVIADPHPGRRIGLALTATPGRTRLLNWFRIDLPKATHGNDAVYFVDLPGYGFASVDRTMRASWRPLMESYLGERATLKVVALLIDIRRGVEDEERDFVPWLLEKKIAVVPVITKADKLGKAKRLPIAAAIRAELGLPRPPVLFSSLEATGGDELWRALLAGLA
jgi:GTP-binding protein